MATELGADFPVDASTNLWWLINISEMRFLWIFLDQATFLISISCISDSCSSLFLLEKRTKPKRAHVSPRNFFHILVKLTISIAINVPKACLIMNELTSVARWSKQERGRERERSFLYWPIWMTIYNKLCKAIYLIASRAFRFYGQFIKFENFQFTTESDLRFKVFGS